MYESLGDLLIFFGGSCHSLMALQIPKGGGFVTYFFFFKFCVRKRGREVFNSGVME